eukprot:scaffold904_cov239-Pinguiococcus_pyrenoidosus.AAC.10
MLPLCDLQVLRLVVDRLRHPCSAQTTGKVSEHRANQGSYSKSSWRPASCRKLGMQHPDVQHASITQCELYVQRTKSFPLPHQVTRRGPGFNPHGPVLKDLPESRAQPFSD